VGNREDLLAGAKKSLYERGYARTTARDIAAAAGTSLAAIGYHFGSTEELMNAALLEAIGEWGDEVQRALSADLPHDANPIDRFEWYWTRVTDSFAKHRKLWAASVEILGQVDRVPGVREALAEGIQEGRLAWASLLQGIDPAADQKTAWAVGSFYQALLSGILVQWLIDPRRAPSGHDLTDALRVIAAGVAGFPDSDMTNAANKHEHRRTTKRGTRGSLPVRRTSATVRGRKKPSP
jgi:AcrR family transcriptional regulator